MVHNIRKYLGFYRPWGYKNNKFIFFYTSNPFNHYKTIRKIYEQMNNDGFFEIAEMNGIHCQAYICYTKKSYNDYYSIYNKVLVNFDHVKNIKKGKIKKWPVLTIDDCYHHELDKVDEFISKVISNTLQKE